MSTLNLADRLAFSPRNMVASLSRGKAATIWSWPVTPVKCQVLEYVTLYLYSTNMPSWQHITQAQWSLRWDVFFFSSEQQSNMFHFGGLSSLLLHILHCLNSLILRPHTSVSRSLKLVHRFPEKVNVYRQKRNYGWKENVNILRELWWLLDYFLWVHCPLCR
jgi:hypothetical protein